MTNGSGDASAGKANASGTKPSGLCPFPDLKALFPGFSEQAPGLIPAQALKTWSEAARSFNPFLAALTAPGDKAAPSPGDKTAGDPATAFSQLVHGPVDFWTNWLRDKAGALPALHAPWLPANDGTALSANPLASYLTDSTERGILFLDVLRQRGNEQEAITSRPSATVLQFDHAELMSGRTLPRPINYSLSRILPPPDVVIDDAKRPVVVVDPRAGQGPGIGGFKTESEIGDALHTGHPVYFINFSAEPVPGQTFLDVVEGQVAFFEHIVALHPKAPRPFAIGNCQAGYQTLMVAMLRPDLFGPCMVAGSPISYWQGVHGKNPMRYSGGLLGGSWLTALTSDLGRGKFDGTWLILNFDALNPANWLWDKQYSVYSQVDTEAGRYLAFEKWWGDFIELNGDEIQFLVDEMFIGDKLTRNQIKARDGTVFDLRSITAPIIVFTSMGDNISPPQQTLGWILDLYRDVEELREAGRTIVYCMNQTVGHLAIFVSSKVGAKEDEEMVRLMDVIDCMPPGLYELVIEPAPEGTPSGFYGTGRWISRFEARTFDDLRALGRNTEDDDRAFATAARVSELLLSGYRTFAQPWVRAVVSQPMADAARALNPLRLSYTAFADSNPLMKQIGPLAEKTQAKRHPASEDNMFRSAEAQAGEQISKVLDGWREARDTFVEKAFFAIYGNPLLQGLVGLNNNQPARELPGVNAEERSRRRAAQQALLARLGDGGFDAALVRAVLAVIAADRQLDERSAEALNAVRKSLLHLEIEPFKALVREQFSILNLAGAEALEALPKLVPDAAGQDLLLEQVQAIAGAPGRISPAETARIAAIRTLLRREEPAIAAEPEDETAPAPAPRRPARRKTAKAATDNGHGEAPDTTEA